MKKGEAETKTTERRRGEQRRKGRDCVCDREHVEQSYKGRGGLDKINRKQETVR